MKKIIIYTDGAAKGNPGNGGYGIVMKYGTYRKEFSEGFRKTTNVGSVSVLSLIDQSNRSSTSNGFFIIVCAPLSFSSFSLRKPHSTPTE